MDSSILSSSFQMSMVQMMLELMQKLAESTETGAAATASGEALSGYAAASSSGNSVASSTSTFADLIRQAAEKYGVKTELVEAVIQAESNFNPQAVSSAGAQGLMQLMPATAQGLGVTDSLDPAQNINGGTSLLRSLLDRYDGNLQLALAAYNAGPGAVDSYQGIPPYQETQTYVQRVMDIYKSNLD